MSKRIYGPCSERQRLFLMDTTTDVILLGGKQSASKGKKQLSNCWKISMRQSAAKVLNDENNVQRLAERRTPKRVETGVSLTG